MLDGKGFSVLYLVRMDTRELIDLLGGPSKVMEDTGLSKGRISQWATEDNIPRPWVKFYRLKRPDINWSLYCSDAMTRRQSKKNSN